MSDEQDAVHAGRAAKERRALIEAAGHSVAAFVGMLNDDPPQLLGSGTLVKYGSIFGVLTCAHVSSAVLAWKQSEAFRDIRPERRQVRILCFGVKGQTAPSFDPSSLLATEFGKAPWKLREPDLAFVRLPPHTESHFMAVGNIRNLERHRKLQKNWEAQPGNFLFVAGAVEEWTAPSVDTSTYRSTKYTTYLSIGRLARQLFTRDGLDRYIYVPKALRRTPLPHSFGGTSGGGVWQGRVVGAEGSRRIEAVLSGVAVMETRRGNLVVHGPNSLFDRLLTRMRETWPEECPSH